MATRRAAADFEPQRALSANLPGATESVKWGADLVHSVGEKMFAIYLLDTLPDAAGVARVINFKVDAERFLELTAVPGVTPAPYLARAKWVQVQHPHGLAAHDLDELVRRSHALVAAGLTKKLQRELGLL